jgi:hypothetical protein
MEKSEFKILQKEKNIEEINKRSIKFQKTSNYIFVR